MKLFKILICIGILMMPAVVGCSNKPYIIKSKAVESLRIDSAENRFSDRNEIEFCHAIEWGNTNKMDAMLSNGIDTNKQAIKNGMTFLIWAYLKKNKISYQYLLKHGANPNIIMVNEETRGISRVQFKYSVLSLSAQDAEDPFWLILALKYGGNPNSYIDKVHILHFAINYESLTNVKLLVENGSDVDGEYKINNYGGTPFESSLIHGRYDIAYYLLDKGADPYLIERNGLNRLINATVHSFHDDYDEQIEWRKKVINMLETKGIYIK